MDDTEPLSAMLDTWMDDPSVDALLESLLQSPLPMASDDEANQAGRSDNRNSKCTSVHRTHDLFQRRTFLSKRVASPMDHTLALIGQADVSTTTAVRTKAQASRPAVKQKKKKRSPPTAKRELVRLRETAKKLECQLRTMRNKYRTFRGDMAPLLVGTLESAPVSLQSGVNIISSTESRSMWEDIALRQAQQRRHAEHENARLKESIDDHAKLLAGIKRFTKRGASSIKDRIPGHLKGDGIRNDVDRNPAVDTATVQQLLTSITEMYDHLNEEVAMDTRFAACIGQFREVSCGGKDGELPKIAIYERRVVPFGMQPTANAIWNRHAWRIMQPGRSPYSCLVAEDTLVKTFLTTLTTPLHAGTIQGTLVGRRYTHMDQEVILWAVELTGPVTAIVPFRRIQSWTVVRKSDTNPADSSSGVGVGGGTQIESKHVADPASMSTSTHASAPLSCITDLVLRGISQYQDKIHRSVDDIMLNEFAMRRPLL